MRNRDFQCTLESEQVRAPLIYQDSKMFLLLFILFIHHCFLLESHGVRVERRYDWQNPMYGSCQRIQKHSVKQGSITKDTISKQFLCFYVAIHCLVDKIGFLLRPTPRSGCLFSCCFLLLLPLFLLFPFLFFFLLFFLFLLPSSPTHF